MKHLSNITIKEVILLHICLMIVSTFAGVAMILAAANAVYALPYWATLNIKNITMYTVITLGIKLLFADIKLSFNL